MAENNNLPATNTQIKALLSAESTKKRFGEILGQKAAGFISSIISAINGSAELQKCVPETIIGSAALAASLDLPIVEGLGFAGLIPYWNTKKGVYECQFQIFKKGYIQLAQRSGQVKLINVCEVLEGQLKSYNKFTGEYEFQDAKISDKVIGYVAFVRLINGFQKYKYMTIDELSRHAKKYSSSFRKGNGKWADKTGGGFEQMSEKTVLKLLLSSYSTLSIEMQKAIIYDQSSIEDTNYKYIDNEKDLDKIEIGKFEKERIKIISKIESITTIEELEALEQTCIEYDVTDKIVERKKEILNLTAKKGNVKQAKIDLP